MAALGAMRSGPVFIGLAAGAWLDQVGLRPATVRQVAEAASVIEYLIECNTNGFEGRHYSVAPGFRLNYQVTDNRPSLMIGGWGERMLHLAGEIADEVKVGGTAAPEMATLARERIAPGALQGQRDPTSIGVVLGAVTIVDEDRKVAVEEARRRAATYIPVIGRLDTPAAEAFPDAIAAVSDAARRGDMEAASRAIPDALLARFAFAGTAADVIRQVESCLAAGASRVDFGSPAWARPYRRNRADWQPGPAVLQTLK